MLPNTKRIDAAVRALLCALYVDLLIATCVPVFAGSHRERVRELNELFALHDGGSLQVRETVRSRALFLCSFVFSLGVFLQLAAIALDTATHHPRPPCFTCRQSAGATSHASGSCEVRLLQVDVLRARWMWTRTSVYRHCSRARCTGRRILLRRRMRKKTMMCRAKKKNELERDETHVIGYDLMVRMLICYFGKCIRILSSNIILVKSR